MFTGKANWDDIAMVVEALDVPVIGNGDLNTADDVIRMKEHTNCAGVMIGRGSFGNPWLFRDARALLDGEAVPPPPEPAEKFAVALEHARLALELQGDTRSTMVEFRKHFGWYTRGLHGASDAPREALPGRAHGRRRTDLRRVSRLQRDGGRGVMLSAAVPATGLA